MHAPAEPTSTIEAPLVAVVIPVYNAASTLAHTVQSVTNQTYRNLEILLVDDGSSDASPEIAQRLAEQDARIRVIRQANQGVAATRNNGAHAAKADYIAFLDNDDLWHPTKIEKQLSILIERGPDYGFVYAPCRIIARQAGCIRLDGIMRGAVVRAGRSFRYGDGARGSRPLP